MAPVNKSVELATTDHPSADPILELDSFLPYRLSMLSHLVSNGIATLYKRDAGLSTAQWRVLAAVAEEPGITAQRVVELTPMDKVKVSRAVSALSDMKLLRRRASASDGRVALLTLTPQGRRIYRQIAPRAAEFADRLLDRLTPEERDAYYALTARLTEAAREMIG